MSWEKKRFVLITLSKHCLPGVNIFESPSSNYEIFTLNKMQEQQYENVNNSSVNSMFTCQPLREKCPNRSFFWSLFRHFSHSERVTTTEYCREYMCSDARSLLIMFFNQFFYFYFFGERTLTAVHSAIYTITNSTTLGII